MLLKWYEVNITTGVEDYVNQESLKIRLRMKSGENKQKKFTLQQFKIKCGIARQHDNMKISKEAF